MLELDVGRNGVLIILSSKWWKCVKSFIAYDDRIIMIKLKDIPNDIAILKVYMPEIQTSEDEVEAIYENIEELIKLTNGNENLIIMGDWNATMGEGTEAIEVGRYGLGT